MQYSIVYHPLLALAMLLLSSSLNASIVDDLDTAVKKIPATEFQFTSETESPSQTAFKEFKLKAIENVTMTLLRGLFPDTSEDSYHFSPMGQTESTLKSTHPEETFLGFSITQTKEGEFESYNSVNPVVTAKMIWTQRVTLDHGDKLIVALTSTFDRQEIKKEKYEKHINDKKKTDVKDVKELADSLNDTNSLGGIGRSSTSMDAPLDGHYTVFPETIRFSVEVSHIQRLNETCSQISRVKYDLFHQTLIEKKQLLPFGRGCAHLSK